MSEPSISSVEWERLSEETSRRYDACGKFHRGFVRGKLRHDPLYRKMLEPGLLPREGRLVDLGCGRGILLSLIQSAGESRLQLEGVEHRPSIARVAREAMGSGATIRVADVASYSPEPADVILLLDVLLYLRPEVQERVVRRVRDALKPDGTLWIREADAKLGTRFFLTWFGERILALARLQWRQRYYYRSASDWIALLTRTGFVASVRPMWDGTPLANVLIEARRVTTAAERDS